MKQFTFYLLCCLGLSFLHSCKKDPVFSCDEQLNDYAVSTMSEHQAISRDSLAKLGIDTQFAIFNSLSSFNKARIFHEKIDLLISIDSIATDDKVHLSSLNDYLTPAIYNDETLDSFCVNWKSVAFNNLSWDSLKMFTYVETWLSPVEIERYTLSVVLPEGGGGSGQACKCNSRFACNLGLTSCVTGGCTQTTTGCGFLGDNPCGGICDYW
ncbi:MAG: bacteriocin fulvocin C-related protein [Edaphocola sp.]